MMPRKLDILIGTFAYGGNGGTSSEVPEVRLWLEETLPKMRADPRIGRIYELPTADTPVTMSRNRCVVMAQENHFDLLLMIDSDMAPDCEIDTDPNAKPFWETAFNFLYERYDRGPVLVAAPYVGPPGSNEPVVVAEWRSLQSDHPNENDYRLELYSREEAATLSGIREAAAVPTGLILFDMRVFDLSPPANITKTEILQKYKAGELELWEAERLLEPGWFYYEWSDMRAFQKGSTEDISSTRDISLMGVLRHGYNPVFCAWDCWAGHWKPKMCRKPKLIPSDAMAKRFNLAAEKRMSSRHRNLFVRSDITKTVDWAKAICLEAKPGGNGNVPTAALAGGDDS